MAHGCRFQPFIFQDESTSLPIGWNFQIQKPACPGSGKAVLQRQGWCIRLGGFKIWPTELPFFFGGGSEGKLYKAGGHSNLYMFFFKFSPRKWGKLVQVGLIFFFKMGWNHQLLVVYVRAFTIEESTTSTDEMMRFVPNKNARKSTSSIGSSLLRTSIWPQLVERKFLPAGWSWRVFFHPFFKEMKTMSSPTVYWDGSLGSLLKVFDILQDILFRGFSVRFFQMTQFPNRCQAAVLFVRWSWYSL